MSLSLVAVFIPLLLMGGIVGRLFREFAVTMAAAIVISMVVSLTATPMMCAHLLKEHERHGRLYRWSERVFAAVVSAYGRTLDVVLRYAVVTLARPDRHDRVDRVTSSCTCRRAFSRSRTPDA